MVREIGHRFREKDRVKTKTSEMLQNQTDRDHLFGSLLYQLFGFWGRPILTLGTRALGSNFHSMAWHHTGAAGSTTFR